MKKEFHIDVTPEEDSLFRDIETTKQEQKLLKPKSNLSVIALVVFLHVAGACALMAFSSKDDKQLAKDILNQPSLEEMKAQVAEQPIQPVQPVAVATPQPTPNPTPLPNMDVPMDSKPKEVPIAKTKPEPVKNKSPQPVVINTKVNCGLIKEYVVKKGDTVYSIAKKFKLRTDRLLQINGIKDPNKIVEGQKLKFM